MASKSCPEILAETCLELRKETDERNKKKEKAKIRKRGRTTVWSRLSEKTEGSNKRTKQTTRRDGVGPFCFGAGVFGSCPKPPNAPSVNKIILTGVSGNAQAAEREVTNDERSEATTLSVAEIVVDAEKQG